MLLKKLLINNALNKKCKILSFKEKIVFRKKPAATAKTAGSGLFAVQ